MSMTGSLLPSPWFTPLSTSGAIMPGCLAYFWVSGTAQATPATTYSDVNLTVANLNPVVGDAYGRLGPIYLSPGSYYDIVLKTSLGVTVREQDYIPGTPTTAVAGSVDQTVTLGENVTAGQVGYISDGSGSKTAGYGYVGDNSNAYSSTLPVVGIWQSTASSGATASLRTDGTSGSLTGLVAGSYYYISTSGTITLTQPANARVLGQALTATTLALGTRTQAVPVLQTTVLTGSNNNFAATTARVLTLYANNATALTLTGLAAGAHGDQIVFAAIGAGSFTLSHQSASSTAANRIITPNAVDMTVTGGVLQYETTNARWRLIAVTPAPTAAYTATLANVIGTAAATTFLSFSVPSMADGDRILVNVSMLYKNAKGSDGTAILAVAYGGSSATVQNGVTLTNGATEYKQLWQLELQRVGSDLWIRGDGTSGAIPTAVGISDSATRAVVASAPTFTSAQTVTAKLTLSAADAAFYFKPQSAVVRHEKALQ